MGWIAPPPNQCDPFSRTTVRRAQGGARVEFPPPFPHRLGSRIEADPSLCLLFLPAGWYCPAWNRICSVPDQFLPNSNPPNPRRCRSRCFFRLARPTGLYRLNTEIPAGPARSQPWPSPTPWNLIPPFSFFHHPKDRIFLGR